MVEKYINPHTDFGFKRLFGSEFNKELLKMSRILIPSNLATVLMPDVPSSMYIARTTRARSL